MTGKFPCTSCGACCRHVREAVGSDVRFLDKGSAYYFPYGWDEDGVCEKLGGNLCTIYETRPVLCSIDKFGDMEGIDRGEFHKINIAACNALIEKDGLPMSYRIR